MSQFFIDSVSSPLPPAVPTSFVTDSGTATPAANVLNVVTPGGGTQGVATSASGNTITITVTDNSVSGTTTTVGAVTGNVITFALGAVAGVYTWDCKIAGFTTAGGTLGAGYTIVGAVRTDGATATLLPNQAVDSFEEGALSAGNGMLTVSGNNVIFQVTGTAGYTIDWKGVAEYVFRS